MRRMVENAPAFYHAMAGMRGVPPGGANFVTTNVPGPMIPLYSVGHRLTEHYPMVPLAGDLGIGVGITSFDRGLYLGVMCDPTILGDVDAIGDLIADEFRRLREAAGVAVDDLPKIGARPARSKSNANGAAAVPERATPIGRTPVTP
jgi:hypothetical protein